jgi:hypothetical protein
MMILIYFWWEAKTVAGSYMRVTMDGSGRFAGLGSKIGPKPPPRYHWKALNKGFRLVNKNVVVPV